MYFLFLPFPSFGLETLVSSFQNNIKYFCEVHRSLWISFNHELSFLQEIILIKQPCYCITEGLVAMLQLNSGVNEAAEVSAADLSIVL